jgi:D-alanyl-D-alanine-carboxypeptidase/D-alanyl-D-alanine-endopeptidase
MPTLSCTTAVLMVPLLVACNTQAVQAPRAPVPPADDEIRRILAERVGAIGEGVGIVVAVVAPEGRRFVSYGHRSQGDPRPLDGDTAFEIGSVTKVFTSLLLADMVRRREVALVDPVANYLPAGAKIPQRNGRSITLVDLATHTSGLPFMPDDADDAVAATDGGTYSAARLYRFLARYELQRDIGAQRDYSNIGYWLLSEALASRAGMDYESLLRERILLPLGMTSTAITLSPEMRATLAVGHDASLRPSPLFSDMPIYSLMPAAGGLISTAKDLSKFLAAVMGYERSALAPALAITLGTRRPTSSPTVEQALAWMVERQGDDPLIFHDGGTWGYASAVAWDPKQRVGVVVLSNHGGSVADIARHLLRPSVPLEKPIATKHTEIALDPAVLDTYVGRYEAQGEGIFVVLRESGFLTLQLPPTWGLPKLRLRPESVRDFFVAELPLRVTFQTDGKGRVNGLLVYPPRGQRAVPATRAVDEPPDPPA